MPAEAPPVDPNAVQNMQDRKLAFVNGPVDRRTVSADRVANPASPYVVQAGTVIPAALITGIHSDLPGQVTAQVTEHVYDTPTGKFLLIPQGARLIGQYDSQVAFGQKRVLLVWNRIMLPNGKSIVLERQQGADAQGFSGLEDEVDYHWWDLAKAAALSTLLGIGTELGSSRRGERSRAGAAPRLAGFDQQHRTAARAPPAQHPADAHDPPGIPGARDRQPRSCDGALRSGGKPMTKLKLGAIEDDKPVKLTVELPAAVHRSLVAYAEAIGREGGQAAPDPAKLIAPMIEKFMATDRAFAKSRRSLNIRKPD